MTFIILLSYSHLLVCVDIYQLYPGYFLYTIQPSNYKVFTSYSSLVLAGFLPPFLLSIFAMLTLKNLYRGRIQPANAGPTAMNTHRSKDRQLAIMLLGDIIIFTLFPSMVIGFNIHRKSIQYQNKNAQQQAFETFLLNLLNLLLFVPSATSFYIYVTVSKTFHRKITEIFFTVYRHPTAHNGQSQAISRTVTVHYSTVR
jgi:hypothetical protein